MSDRYDISIDQGTTWSLLLTWRDSAGTLINLTGYTARLVAKDAGGTIVLSLTELAGITLGGAAGTITLAQTDTQTAAFTFSRANYNLEVESGAGATTRLIEGAIIVSPEV